MSDHQITSRNLNINTPNTFISGSIAITSSASDHPVNSTSADVIIKSKPKSAPRISCNQAVPRPLATDSEPFITKKKQFKPRAPCPICKLAFTTKKMCTACRKKIRAEAVALEVGSMGTMSFAGTKTQHQHHQQPQKPLPMKKMGNPADGIGNDPFVYYPLPKFPAREGDGKGNGNNINTVQGHGKRKHVDDREGADVPSRVKKPKKEKVKVKQDVGWSLGGNDHLATAPLGASVTAAPATSSKQPVVAQGDQDVYQTEDSLYTALRAMIGTETPGRPGAMSFRGSFSIIAVPAIDYAKRASMVSKALRSVCQLPFDTSAGQRSSSRTAFSKAFPCQCTSQCSGTVLILVSDDTSHFLKIAGQKIYIEVNHK